HIRDMDDAAVQGSGRGGGKRLLVHLLAGHIFAGVDVDIAHAGEDQAVVTEDVIGLPQIGPDGANRAVVDNDLAGANAVDVGQSALNDYAVHETAGLGKWKRPRCAGAAILSLSAFARFADASRAYRRFRTAYPSCSTHALPGCALLRSPSASWA